MCWCINLHSYKKTKRILAYPFSSWFVLCPTTNNISAGKTKIHIRMRLIHIHLIMGDKKNWWKYCTAYVWVVPSNVPGAILSSFSSSTLNTSLESKPVSSTIQLVLNIRQVIKHQVFHNLLTHLIKRPIRFFSLLLTQVNNIRSFNTSRSAEENMGMLVQIVRTTTTHIKRWSTDNFYQQGKLRLW